MSCWFLFLFFWAFGASDGHGMRKGFHDGGSGGHGLKKGFHHGASDGHGLKKGFYRKCSPKADMIVRNVTWKLTAADPFLQADLLRLHYHDCFV